MYDYNLKKASFSWKNVKMYLFYIVEKVKYITAIEHLGLFKVENFPRRPTIRQHFSRYFWPPQIKFQTLAPEVFTRCWVQHEKNISKLLNFWNLFHESFSEWNKGWHAIND